MNSPAPTPYRNASIRAWEIYLALAGVVLAAFGFLTVVIWGPSGWFGFVLLIAPVALALLASSGIASGVVVPLTVSLRHRFVAMHMLVRSSLVLVALVIALVVWHYGFSPKRFDLFDWSLRREITSKVSLADLQSAVIGLLAREDDTRAKIRAAGSAGSAASSFPDPIRRLHARRVLLASGQGGRPSYMIFGWGGGQAHWGVQVGPGDLSLPTNRTQWRWQDGVYAYLGN